MTMMMDIFIDDLFGKKNSEVKGMARTITVKGIGWSLLSGFCDTHDEAGGEGQGI